MRAVPDPRRQSPDEPKAMTVGELRAALAEYPANLPIVAWEAGDPSVGIQEVVLEITGASRGKDYGDDGTARPDPFVTLVVTS